MFNLYNFLWLTSSIIIEKKEFYTKTGISKLSFHKLCVHVTLIECDGRIECVV